SEHLGHLTAEPLGDRVSELLEDPLRLAALRSLAALTELCLPEREAHPALFDATEVVIEALAQAVPDWPQAYIRWELGLLAELGYGLDLTHCAATGATEDLTHVS